MEHPHNLLMLVINQHYNQRPNIIENANQMIKSYSETNDPNYETTLGNLYQLMNDLQSDILLYFLTTVPLPKDRHYKSSSVLVGLMKQMLCTPYHNSMRPILLKYLNDHVPKSTPLSSSKVVSNSNLEQLDSKNADNNLEENNVKSLIDEYILQEKKQKNKKKGRIRYKLPVKLFQVKSLSSLCATNIYKYQKSYQSKYRKQGKKAWKIINSNKCNKNDLSLCYDVIRDVNKKMEWLSMFRNGNVPSHIMENEYGNSDVFFLKNQDNFVTDDILTVNAEIINSVNVFLSKC